MDRKQNIVRIKPIKPRRLYQQVADQIAGLLQDGAFAVGQKLPSETELARQFEVSRPTIREAMIALETLDLIDVQNGNGAFVRNASPRSVALFRAGADPGPGPYEQFEVREVIEGEIAARAATRIEPAALAELELILCDMEVSYRLDPIADRDGLRFHVALAKASANSVFAGLIEELWRMRENDMWKTIRSRIVRQADRQHAIDCRRAVIEALKRRDPDGARLAMKSMLDRARANYFGDLPINT